MAQSDTLEYVGQELDIFVHAVRWKSYWSSSIRKWVKGDVLEAGAGLGANTPLFYHPEVRSLACMEPDPQLAGRLEQVVAGFPKGRVIVGTLASVLNERFDSIVYIDVLEHIEADRQEVASAAKLLRPGGHLIVLSPAHQFLYSEFDASIGHFRRYTKATLGALQPPGCKQEALFYLDSLGLCASLANKLMLKQSLPTVAQIKTWDTFIIPVSRQLDPLIGFTAGKTIVAVWTRSEAEI